MKKKVLLVLAIFLVGMFIPKIVYAEDHDLNLKIYIDEEVYDILDGEFPEGVTYDSATQTLTLNNFEGTAIGGDLIDLTIVLKGENSLTGSNDAALALGRGTLTIKGDGSLDIESSDECLVVFGKLVIESGTINISADEVGVYVVGDFEMNGGELNIEGCEGAIYQDDSESEVREEMGYPAKETFLAKGGKINIKDCDIGIVPGGAFILDGTDILITDVYAGLYTTEHVIVDGYLEFNSGSLIIKDLKEGEMTWAISLGYSLEELAEEDLIRFNSDNLYIEDSKYDFIIIDIESNKLVTIAEEGLDPNDEETYDKVATEISILPRTKYEVTEGDGQKVYQSAKAIKIDADLDKFVALYINDELVDEENYDLEEGSTVIKLKDEYVKKLEAGNYKFKAVFTDGVAEGEFTVTTENPETGDNIITYIMLLMLSVGSLVMIRKRA